MGSAWEVSGGLATEVFPDPVTSSLIWLLTMLSSDFFSINILFYADLTEKILIIWGKGGWIASTLTISSCTQLARIK